jgi:hypothetical protein
MYEAIINKIKKYEDRWCEIMNYDNVYITAFKYPLSPKIEPFDLQAYKKYPNHNFVYDKLWVAESQQLACGRIALIEEQSDIQYPIFIKPRWGHKTSTSRNCFKIKNYQELVKYKKIKEDMMWSEYIDGTEAMTDFMLVQGKIVYQITYRYSHNQHGYIDEWKYISPTNKCPSSVEKWVQKHMSTFTGPVNVQYRKTTIIEVSLRLARGGAYIQATQNRFLIQNINNVVEKNMWNYSLENKLDFSPYYSFKAYTESPLFYLFPYNTVKLILERFSCMPFFEYYFEPSGNDGMVFLQFMHSDYKQGMKCKTFLERSIKFMNYFLIYTIIYCMCMIFFKTENIIFIILFFVLFFIFLTRFLNPIDVQYKLLKANRQKKLS